MQQILWRLFGGLFLLTCLMSFTEGSEIELFGRPLPQVDPDFLFSLLCLLGLALAYRGADLPGRFRKLTERLRNLVGSPPRDRIQVALWTLFAALIVAAITILVTGGTRFEVLGKRISLTSAHSMFVLLCLVAATLWVRRRKALGEWDRVRSGMRAHLRETPRLVLAAQSLLLLALMTNALTWADDIDKVNKRLRKSPNRHFSLDKSQPHVPVIVAAVTSRADASPIAIHIEENDSRAHLSSFYSYPRLLKMEPAQRRWSLVQAMLDTESQDPAFSPQAKPSNLDRSLRFAEDGGMNLIEVIGLKEREVILHELRP